MGQAKERGTHEQRKAEALAVKQQLEVKQKKERQLEKFKRTKPHANVGTIGHNGTGKATLMASIAAGVWGSQAFYVNRDEEPS